MLTEHEIKQYREQGFLCRQGLLTREEVEALGRVVDELVAAASDLEGRTEFYDFEPSHRKGDPRVRRLKNPNKQHPAFLAVAKHPVIVEMIDQLFGGVGVRFSHPSGKVNIKAAQYGSPVEWHQDWAGYPHTNDDLLSVSIPLDDVEMENGPLLVIPGSHTGPVLDHHMDGVYCSTIDPERKEIPYDKAVPLTGKVGLVTFHHARIIHGSALNTSKRSRRLLINQYAAVDAWPLAGVKDLDAFNAAIICGQPTLQPRMVSVPVRIPLPISPDFDGLYSNQAKAKNKYFQTYEQTIA